MTSDAPCEAARFDPASDTPSMVLLVHGAWHGGWCWAGLQADLDRRGIASLAGDLAATMLPTEDGSATVLDPATAPRALCSECSPAAIAAAMAARCTHQLELDTDHSSFLSSVNDMAGIVETVARASTQDGTR